MAHKDELQAKRDELQKALAALDVELLKSVQTDGDPGEQTDVDENLEQLLKSLEEEAEALEKALDGDGDDGKGGDPNPGDDECCPKCGKKDCDGKCEAMEKSEQAPTDLIKSLQEVLNGDAFQNASEAYESLEKSVNEGFARMGDIPEAIETMSQAVKAGLSMQIGMAKCIGELVKSVQEIGAQPVGASRSRFGIGNHETPTPKGIEGKTNAEIQEALEKAVQEHKVDTRCLGIWGTYKNVDRLPSDAQELLRSTFQ